MSAQGSQLAVRLEVSEDYCRAAVGARLHAAPRPDVAGPLFGGLR